MSESLTFGELSAQSKDGAGVGSHTRGVFVLGGIAASPEAFSNTIEFITLSTSGEVTDFGDATSNTGAIQNNSASNTIRGVYHNARSANGGSVKNIIEIYLFLFLFLDVLILLLVFHIFYISLLSNLKY